jgi:hypothetical protein
MLGVLKLPGEVGQEAQRARVVSDQRVQPCLRGAVAVAALVQDREGLKEHDREDQLGEQIRRRRFEAEQPNAEGAERDIER